MKTIKKVPFTLEWIEFVPNFKDMEQGVMYISEMFETESHLCLCGCGNLVVTPFGIGDMGWEYTMKEGKISITPSLGNYQLPCKSHYIITNSVANFV